MEWIGSPPGLFHLGILLCHRCGVCRSRFLHLLCPYTDGFGVVLHPLCWSGCVLHIWESIPHIQKLLVAVADWCGCNAWVSRIDILS